MISKISHSKQNDNWLNVKYITPHVVNYKKVYNKILKAPKKEIDIEFEFPQKRRYAILQGMFHIYPNKTIEWYVPDYKIRRKELEKYLAFIREAKKRGYKFEMDVYLKSKETRQDVKTYYPESYRLRNKYIRIVRQVLKGKKPDKKLLKEVLIEKYH